ncbi:MAG: purine-nucleoside phosphorylase [Clostridium sp.]|nr:purine-nucleoside phosphorylase [Clostridium sp.]MCM1547968.1 purine-nucleoside phosphorylase [Ruminococcus sp.]
MPTPHNSAEKGAIAKTVLMPGDPLRAEFIAKTYLEDPVCYNKVRGMLGFTGKYKGKEISVQGSGMGIPSIGIYSHELFTEYDVENIIRVGTAGGIAEQVGLRDVLIAMGACTNSNFAAQFDLPGTYAPTASYKLLSSAVKAAESKGCVYHVGNILSSDTFYDDSNSLAKWQKMNVLGVEMESAALYMNAARYGRNALCILTVSDCPLKGLSTTPEERQTTFTDMMEIALEAAI